VTFFVLLFASPNIYKNTELDLVALVGSLSGAWQFLLRDRNQQQLPCNSATPRNPSHDNDNLWMTKSFARYLIGCFKEIKFV